MGKAGSSLTAPQAAQAAQAGIRPAMQSFIQDTFRAPESGLAGQNVFNSVAKGELPNVGDVATYALQKMLNNYIQQSLGPAYQPVTNAVAPQPQRSQQRRF